MNLDLLIIASYLVISIILGLYSTKKTDSTREYIIGGKDFPTFFLFATITATCIGGGSTVSHAAEVVKFGILVSLANMGQICEKLITANVLVPRMGRFLDKLTVGEILEDTYGTPARVVTGICGALFSAAVLAAQIKALSFLISYFLPVSNIAATIGSCAVFIFYSAIGGVRAVTITDVLQFIALAITVPMVLNVGLFEVGGWSGLIEKVPANHLNIFADSKLIARYSCIFLLFSIPCFDPAIMQRILMGKNITQVRTAFNLSALFDLPFYLIAGLIGLIVVALAPNVAPNQGFLYLIDNILPVGIKGLAISGMLAVVMSTADSYLNVTSAYVVHDIVRPIKRLSDAQELSLMRWITVLIGAFAVSMALAFESIYELVLFSYNFWAPVVVVPLLVVIFGYNPGKLPFFTGAFAGLTTFVLWDSVFDLSIRTGVDSVIPNLVVSFGVFLVTWMITNPKQSNAAIVIK
ncbi:MAG: sodium:solute symporter family protein [Rickettsiaceae bacterium]|jgi:SSS family solute:Na+ symporter|nr:sodium:solute symporter family protein [Rickettsiaceae bacterium]